MKLEYLSHTADKAVKKTNVRRIKMKNILTILSDVGVQVEESLHETVLKAVAK